MSDQHPEEYRSRLTALLVGTDEILLYTRRAILQKHGYRVSIAAPEAATTLLRTNPFDVIVACHSLSPAESDALVEAARTSPVHPALVGYYKDLAPRPTAHPYDTFLWSLSTPEDLVGAVQSLVRPN